MTGAFLYLYFTTARNALVERLKRLRQPKYLIGAVIGGAYFYFVVFGRAFAHAPRRAPAPMPAPADLALLFEPVAALVVAVVVLLAWLFGNSRAALQFSEPEVAFLFPAPVSRRRLIHYKLLRSQLGILVSALIVTLVFRRLEGHLLQHTAGWWVAFSTLNLHFIGASFTRQRLLERGLHPWLQRALFAGVFLLLAGLVWWFLPAPAAGDLAGFRSLAGYIHQVFSTAPLSWLLAPFVLVVKPYFAAGPAAFFLALGPALLLLAAHYWWVIRADVSFEEASLELAARRARIASDVRAGHWSAGGRPPVKPRPEPFKLAARGWAPVAFLWKNLIALGPFFRLRTWLIACAILAALTSWLGADRARAEYLVLLLTFSGGFAIFTLVGGPLFMRREVQQTLTQLDLIKAQPLAGWQIVLGQLLSPIVLLTLAEWFFLLAFTLSLAAAKKKLALTALLGAGGLGAATLVVPPLVGLLLCLPYASVLYFPAWAITPAGQPGGAGLEMMGQRLIFMLGYLVVLAVALLPAAAAAGLAFFIVNAFIGKITAFVAATLVVSAALGAELAAAVWWLGEKLERFDLSTEMPR